MVRRSADQTEAVNRTSFAPVSPLRALLLGLAAGTGAGLIALALGRLTLTLVVELTSDEVVGANIGAGLIAMAVTLAAGPLLAWFLLRLVRLPMPLETALLSVPFHLAFAVLLLSAGPAVEGLLWDHAPGVAEATSPAVPWYVLDIAGIALAVALSALLVALWRRRGASPGASTPTTP